MTKGTSANDQPGFVAHRGWAARYPENTLESLTAAVDTGARFIEFDVQLTRDQVPVLLHDDNLARTAGVGRSVFDLDAADLASIEVNQADRFGDQFSDVHVPLLEQIVSNLASWPDVTAFVELKRQSIGHFGAATMARQVLAQLQPVLDSCVVISFIHDAVTEVRRRVNIPIGWVIRTWDEPTRTKALAAAPEYLFCKHTILPKNNTPVWPGPWKWVCYGVSDLPLAMALAERGVAFVSTFEIGELLAAAQTQGARQ
ncbi:MAG: glycerophosphodiester phosphodiesterase family protein [Gammaproteobacteria bacterium]|nr:glycerophosphodiester phosphodiesterase family protein [Gammaproteobacteria bacterium]